MSLLDFVFICVTSSLLSVIVLLFCVYSHLRYRFHIYMKSKYYFKNLRMIKSNIEDVEFIKKQIAVMNRDFYYYFTENERKNESK